MRLQTKFILSVTAALIVIMGLAGWCWHHVQEAQFEDAAVRDLERTEAFLEATRAYTRDVLKPALAKRTDEFVNEVETPSTVARGVFDRFAKSHENYRYKEASDNPINPRNYADSAEQDLLMRLRDTRPQQITTFVTDLSGEEWFIGAKPIVADESCLQCHGSPSQAPIEQLARFGTEHGFHWKAGDVVAALTVRVPTRELRVTQATFRKNLVLWFSMISLTMLIVVYVAARRFVCVPVMRMGREMEQIAQDEAYGRMLTEAAGNAELSAAARAFNGVLNVVRKSVISMRDANENLEERVRERTAELALGHAELAAVHETALDCIIMMDHQGMITNFNPAAEQTFGYAKEQVLGHRLSELLIPEDYRESHEQNLEQFLETGEGAILGKRVEVPALRGDGSEFPVEVAVNAIVTGGPPKFVAYLRDITERKLAELEAQKAEKLALVAARTDNAVIITDANGLIEWVNEGFTRISGYTPEEVTGHKPGSFLQGEETDPATVEHIRSCLREGNGFQTEIVNYGKDGRKYWLAIECQPIHDAEGQLVNFIAIESDITERKQMLEQLRHAKETAEQASADAVAASRAKSEFLANMSHEIRTPLNGVTGMIDLLMGTHLNDTQNRYAGVAKSSADTLLALINDILDFSKIEAGKLELSHADFDLTLVVEEVVEMLAPRAAKKGLELAGYVHEGVCTSLRGDPDRLRQILINLTNNAIKFTEKGEVVIRVTAEPTDGVGDEPTLVRFCVTDTGIGIPKDRLDRLFKSFSQIDASTTRKYGGTGLGLAISKQLAELMGGQIGVESELGKGSTFWVTARLQKRPERVGTSQRTVPMDLRGLRVLAVDDNASHREILQQQLAHWGFDGGTAADAKGALEALRSAADSGRPYSIAILDYKMPDVDGLELAHMIRKIPGLQRTSLIMLTGMGNQLGKAELDSAGFKAYLTKPVRQSQVFDTIIGAVADRRPSDGKSSSTDQPEQAPAQTASARQGAAPRLLLAEDNEVNQMVAAEVLSRAGFLVDIVVDGQQAVESVSTGKYDLVLMDCQMPVMDGFEATRQIRRGEEQGIKANPSGRIPIIALTANAIKGDRERCLASGMDDYVTKPMDPKRLIAVVESYLCKAREAATPDAAPAPATEVVLPAAPETVLQAAPETDLPAAPATAQAVASENSGMADLERVMAEAKAGLAEPDGLGNRSDIALPPAPAPAPKTGKPRRTRAKAPKPTPLSPGEGDVSPVPSEIHASYLPEDPPAAPERTRRQRKPSRKPAASESPSLAPVNAAVDEAVMTEPLPMDPVTDPIDWDSLFDRCMGDARFVQKMLGKFQTQATDSVDKIRRTVTSRDADATAKLAHSLKGAASYLSAMSVQKAASELEEMGRTGNLLEDADDTLQQLVSEVDRCLEYIPKLIAKAADSSVT